VIQVTGPQTLFLAETEQQLMMYNDDGTVDALQVDQAAGIVGLWWVGPLYAAGSQNPGAVFKPFIGIPNYNTGGLVNANPQAYGLEPTVQTI
jgi:hypothetical protein